MRWRRPGADNIPDDLERRKRISRVAASWPGPIGALTVLWAAVLLRMKLAWRRPGPVRLAQRTGRPLGPVPGRMEDSLASGAANRSPRWRALGSRCPLGIPGTVRLRRGPCRVPEPDVAMVMIREG